MKPLNQLSIPCNEYTLDNFAHANYLNSVMCQNVSTFHYIVAPFDLCFVFVASEVDYNRDFELLHTTRIIERTTIVSLRTASRQQQVDILACAKLGSNSDGNAPTWL